MVIQQNPKLKDNLATGLPQKVNAEVETIDVNQQKTDFAGRPGIKVSSKQLPYIVLGFIIAGIGGLAFSYFQIAKQAELRSFQDDLSSAAKTVDNEFSLTRDATISLAAAARTLYDIGIRTPEPYNRLSLEFFLKRPRLALAHSIAQAPFKLIPSTKWFWGYYYADQGKKEQVGTRLPAPNDKILYAELFKEDDYPTKEYWTIPYNSGKPAWIEPYLWYGINMTSYIHIFRDGKGEILGVTDADMNISEMVELTKEINTTVPSSFYTLLTDQGTIVAYPPDPKKSVDREKIQKVPELSNIWDKIQKDTQGYLVADGKVWAYRRLPSTNWLMLQSVSEVALYANIFIQSLVGATAAILIVSVIFVLYLRTLNQSISLAGLLSEQQQITELQKSESVLAEIQSEISRLQTMLDLDQYLQLYLAEIQRWLKCDRVLIYQFDDKFSGYVISEVAASDLPSALDYQLDSSFIPTGAIENYKQGQALATIDVLNDEFASNNIEIMHRLQVKSNLVVPIFLADKLYGLIRAS